MPDASANQITGHAVGARFGQLLVVFKTTRGIGVPGNIDAGVIEFVQHDSDRIKCRNKHLTDGCGIGGKSDIAGHDQVQIITLTLHSDAGAFQALTQNLFRLSI